MNISWKSPWKLKMLINKSQQMLIRVFATIQLLRALTNMLNSCHHPSNMSFCLSDSVRITKKKWPLKMLVEYTALLWCCYVPWNPLLPCSWFVHTLDTSLEWLQAVGHWNHSGDHCQRQDFGCLPWVVTAVVGLVCGCVCVFFKFFARKWSVESRVWPSFWP